MMSESKVNTVESNGTDEKRKLPKTIGIELDVGSARLPDRDSEEESDGNNEDWEEHVLQSKKKHESMKNDVQKKSQELPIVDDDEHKVSSMIPESVAKLLLPKYADTYELEKYRKNAMIIINHEKFNSPSFKTRTGTMQDEKLLQKTFGKFNFIMEPHLTHPLTKDNVMKELKEFSKKDFREYGCVCVAIMTHGSRYGALRAFDTDYYDEDVIKCFNVCENITLFGKPIIFLIQACRGDNPAIAFDRGNPEQDEKYDNDTGVHYQLPIQCNMIIFHSSYFGQASIRLNDGSWFIKTLCTKISLLADTEDFLSICMAIQRDIALDKSFVTTINSKEVLAKQMPVFVSILIRRLYLRKFEGRDEVDHPDFTSAEGKAIRQAVNNSVPRAYDDNFQRMIQSLSLYTIDYPYDDVARYILENAKNTKITTGIICEKVYTQTLIDKYIKQNTSNRYINYGQQSTAACWCRGKDPRVAETRLGGIFSQCGPAVCSLGALTMVCVLYIAWQKRV